MTTHTNSTLDLPADKTMLDAVMFVATLVSKSNEIDTQLDRVRSITAKHSTDQLTKEDDRVLHEVYDYLENYLIKKESLRSFTRDSIRQRLYDYLGNKKNSNLLAPLSIVWSIAIAGALAAFVIPGASLSDVVKQTLAITIFFATINLGAVWMFWTGLKNFKDEIRKAYLPICLGFALSGITLLQIPVVVWMGEDRSIWFQYIASGSILPIAEGLLYIGMRRFAKIGGINSRLLSAKLVIGLCIGFVLLVNIIPRPESGVPDWTMALSLTILATGAVITAVTATITALVRRSLSSSYKRPLAWFIIYLLISTFSCIQYILLQLNSTVEQPYDPRGIGLLVLVLSAVAALQAGVSFRRIDTTATSKSAIH